MLHQAPPKLALLRLIELNRRRRLCRDAIPDVADKLEALGNRKLENFCLGGAHATDSTTNQDFPLSPDILRIY